MRLEKEQEHRMRILRGRWHHGSDQVANVRIGYTICTKMTSAQCWPFGIAAGIPPNVEISLDHLEEITNQTKIAKQY